MSTTDSLELLRGLGPARNAMLVVDTARARVKLPRGALRAKRATR